MHGDELDVEGPDSVVLGGGQGSQSSVKHSPGPGHLALLGEELAVVNPDLEQQHQEQSQLELKSQLESTRVELDFVKIQN